ncbi:MAG TPA: UDP-N-acetylmuramoyl-tripeptide--D-alanyl-D-alanine ligase [Phycisphaerae bacterium]
MKSWEIDEVRRAVKGKWMMRGEISRAFNGRICTDSRTAAEGDLFIAIKGEWFDAHDFLGGAGGVIEREVAAILVHRELPADLLLKAREKGVAVIGVEDTVMGLNRLAAAYRAGGGGGGFRAKVIAVGGSNGKTTTKRIIHSLLAERFGEAGTCVSPKSFNNNIGMPLTLLEVMPGHEFVVLEIGTNAPGEIAALAEVCRPDVAVITSIGLEHLEKLGDLEGVAREEASVSRHMNDGGVLVLPGDVPELMAALKGSKLQRIFIDRGGADLVSGDSEDARLTLTSCQESLEGVKFSVNGRGEFFVPLLGEHNAVNAVMAIAVARRIGLSDEVIAAGLLKVKGAEGRMEPVRIGEEAATIWVIHDAYNANPTSAEAGLKTFIRIAASGQRRVVVLADMLELGEAGDELHKEVGRQVAALEPDLFVAIGTKMALAADAASQAKGRTRIIRFATTDAACEKISKLAEPGDAVYLKGSHGMRLEKLLESLRNGMHAATSGVVPQRSAVVSVR